jgi:hypothetical protein
MKSRKKPVVIEATYQAAQADQLDQKAESMKSWRCVDGGTPGVWAHSIRASAIETKTYADGTRTTGPAPLPDMSPFASDLASAINRASKENGSNTPDFILAEFLADCLTAFDKAQRRRRAWYEDPSEGIGGA